jgi:hypothetical protein
MAKSNCTLRYEWLTEIIRGNKYRVGAEVGCDLGETTRYLLALNKDLHLYAVDIWQRPTVKFMYGEKPNRTYIYYDDPQYAIKKFTERTICFKDRLTILRGVSWEMASMVTDGSLDFVFIDADHSYDAVYKDIVAWGPKLKPDGLMTGHDIHIISVYKAVQKLIKKCVVTKIDNCWMAKKEDINL